MMMTMKDETDKNKMTNSETLRPDNINTVTGEESVSLALRPVSRNDKSSLNQDS